MIDKGTLDAWRALLSTAEIRLVTMPSLPDWPEERTVHQLSPMTDHDVKEET